MTGWAWLRVLAGSGLLAGCVAPWQAPPGLSPMEQARDQAECQAQANQAAVGEAGMAEVARLQALSQCLEARGWQRGVPTRR
jgi:hypothetical protein